MIITLSSLLIDENGQQLAKPVVLQVALDLVPGSAIDLVIKRDSCDYSNRSSRSRILETRFSKVQMSVKGV